MTVAELIAELDQYGGHVPVMITVVRDNREFVANAIDVFDTHLNGEVWVSIEGNWVDD
jgi:hypothetical protein